MKWDSVIAMALPRKKGNVCGARHCSLGSLPYWAELRAIWPSAPSALDCMGRFNMVRKLIKNLSLSKSKLQIGPAQQCARCSVPTSLEQHEASQYLCKALGC